MSAVPLLLVEGQHDLHVVQQLLKQHRFGVGEQFRIKDQRGDNPLIFTLPVEIKAAGLGPIGVIVDADLSLSSRWDSLKYALDKAGYSPPALPVPDGLILTQAGLPPIGVWIMPNNQLPGSLEDFVALLVPPQDALLPIARHATGNIPAEHRRFSEPDTAKAIIHNWLAWQEEPGTKMGAAFTKKYLDPSMPTALVFVEWVRRLIAAGPSE